jgi:tyrosine-protein kinase Etk/Wzc
MEIGYRELTLRDYLRVLFQHRWLIILTFAAVLSFTIFFTLRMDPVYEASTTLMFETQQMGTSIFNQPSIFQQKNLINNECEIIRSYSLALLVRDSIRSNKEAASLLHEKEVSSIEYLRTNLSVHPVEETDIIEISFQSNNPRLAALIANTYAEKYKEQNLKYNRGEFTEVRKFLEDQLDIVRERLSASEDYLRAFKQKSKLVSLREETTGLVSQLAEFEGLYNECDTELGASLKRLSFLKEQLSVQKSNLIDNVVQVSTPFIQQLREELVNLQTKYSNFLVQGLPQDHPQLVNLQNQIDETQLKLKEETMELVSKEIEPQDPLLYSQDLVDRILSLEVEVETLEAKKSALSGVVEAYAAKLADLPEKELELARLERSYRANESTYMMMLNKYEEIRISEVGEIGNVRIIDQALPPSTPIKPKVRVNIFLGIILGIGLGIGVSFFLDYLDNTIKTIEDIENTIQLNVLGAIPIIDLINTKKGRKLLFKSHESSRLKQLRSRLISHYEPKSPVAEAYRTIRTNIHFSHVERPYRSFLITSSTPEEGKSTTGVNLAITLAQMGARTLLLDTDFRRPVIHSIFGIKKEPGITNVLIGKSSVYDIISPTEIENLFVIPCGVLPPNPSELLASDSMTKMIETLRDEFDFLIFDTPPVIAVTDAVVLSSQVDGVILVVESGKATFDAVNRAKILLQNVNAKIIGSVLNNIDVRRSYHGYDYYHYYHRYYTQGKKSDTGESESENGSEKKKTSRKMLKIPVILGFVFAASVLYTWKTGRLTGEPEHTSSARRQEGESVMPTGEGSASTEGRKEVWDEILQSRESLRIHRPMVIHMDSFQKRERAVQARDNLQENGYSAFIMKSVISGGKPWYRVFVGSYKDREEAIEGLRRLRKEGRGKYLHILHLPYSICIGSYPSPDKAYVEEEVLREKGLFPYLQKTVSGNGGDSYKLLVGVFPSFDQAFPVSQELKKQKIENEIVLR